MRRRHIADVARHHSLQVCERDEARGRSGPLDLVGLACDKQEEGNINRRGIALTARPTGMLAINPNCIRIAGPVSRIAPRVYGAGGQSVSLNPSAPAFNCLYVLSEINLILTDPQSLGVCWGALETACDGAT
jgi:hypothetical protein